MNYNIKGTGLTITDELRTYAERQLAHADKLIGVDTTAHTDIELQFDQLHDGGKYRAEFTLTCKGSLYRAGEWGSTMHEAIDLAGAELVNELRVVKKQRLSRLRRTGVAVKEYLRGWRRKV